MGLDAIVSLVIRICLAVGCVAFVMTFLIYPLINLFVPVMYMAFPLGNYAIVYHLLRAFTFMLGLWALSKVLA